MKSIEKVAKTVDSAITEALIELGASTDEVNIEVISKGSKGLLGFGAKAAKVRVTLKKTKIEEDLQVKEVKPELLKVKVEPEVSVSSVSDKSVSDSEETVVVSKEEVEQVIKNAENFLDKLLKQMEIDCTIHSEIINNNRISIGLEGKNMGIIIGKRGETLDAIQYLVNIVANKEEKNILRLC